MNILEIPDISYFSILRRTKHSRKFPKTVLETRLKSQETTYDLVYGRVYVGAFSVLLDSGLFQEEKNRFGISEINYI
jgi:hypothetical protein